MRTVPDHKVFRFEWPVDQSGYDIKERRGDGATLAGQFKYDEILPRGGPPKFYRPMDDHAGLWREFADTCVTTEGALAFSHEFGLLAGPRFPLNEVFDLAEHLRNLMNAMDASDWHAAASIFSFGRGRD